MNPLLPAVFACFAFGLALAALPARVCGTGLLLFGAGAIASHALCRSTIAYESALLGCWISAMANAASVYAPTSRVFTALAANTGCWLGCLIAANETVAATALLVLLGVPIRSVAGSRPIAMKILASWVLSIAILAALLQFIPVTPGYQADHIE